MQDGHGRGVPPAEAPDPSGEGVCGGQSERRNGRVHDHARGPGLYGRKSNWNVSGLLLLGYVIPDLCSQSAQRRHGRENLGRDHNSSFARSGASGGEARCLTSLCVREYLSICIQPTSDMTYISGQIQLHPRAHPNLRTD